VIIKQEHADPALTRSRHTPRRLISATHLSRTSARIFACHLPGRAG
jgi:hypothetical protein